MEERIILFTWYDSSTMVPTATIFALNASFWTLFHTEFAVQFKVLVSKCLCSCRDLAWMEGAQRGCVDYALRMHMQKIRGGWLVAFHILFLPSCQWGASVMHEPHASGRSHSGLTCWHSNFATVHNHIAITQLFTGFSIFMPSYLLTVCEVRTLAL